MVSSRSGRWRWNRNFRVISSTIEHSIGSWGEPEVAEILQERGLHHRSHGRLEVAFPAFLHTGSLDAGLIIADHRGFAGLLDRDLA
jgi:hypothetical protein